MVAFAVSRAAVAPAPAPPFVGYAVIRCPAPAPFREGDMLRTHGLHSIRLYSTLLLRRISS